MTVDLERGHFERLIRRRHPREQRNGRHSAGTPAIILALASFAAVTSACRTAEPLADEPTPPGIFSEVGGWITYGDDRGIWAVDPSQPANRESQIQLSRDQGIPLAWSSDGSKLLILGAGDGSRYEGPGSPIPGRLFVFNADGSVTNLATIDFYSLGGGWSSPEIGGSFSPDGSRVIFASKSSVDVVDTQGGTPQVLQTASDRWFSVNGSRTHALSYNPRYSPDGTQIAYFDGPGDGGGEEMVHQLRVMKADGSSTRVVVDDLKADVIHNLAWSPDGERLAFGLGSEGIYIVGADGSGLALAIPDGTSPYWSPDGSRISYQLCSSDSDCLLRIADADGTHVMEFAYGSSGPWNPLEQPEP